MDSRVRARAAALAMSFSLLAMLAPAAYAGASPSISSDLSNYVPGEAVHLAGSGWGAGEAVHIFVNDNDGQTWSHSADVVSDESGSITDTFVLPDWFIAVYYVTATGTVSGTATTTFTDANVQIDNGSKPPDPTNSTSASFGLDTSPGTQATDCQLDGAAFVSCTSPASYAALSEGSHTFVVRLTADHSKTATYTWFVDLTSPDTTITGTPSNPTTSTSASFAFSGTDNHTTQQAKFTFQCSLDGGGFAACNSGKNYTGLALGSHTFDVRAIDEAGNVDGTPAHYGWTIQSAADTTPPVLSKIVSGTTGLNGWYTSNVQVVWTVTDPDSAVVIDSGCGTQTFNTDTASATSSCSAHSAGGSASDSVTVKLDKTGPSASLAVTVGTAGSNGWYTSDVTVGTSGTDSISGPVTCTADQTQTTETIGTPFNGSCTNDAGLTTNADPLTVKLDKTAPVISDDGPTPSTPDGLHGWYVSAVSNAFSASDDVSGLDVACATGFPKSVSTGASEGAAVTVPSESCSDLAGNTNAGINSAQFMIDLTGPSASLSVTAGTPGANGWYVTDVTVQTSGSDSGSDNVSCTADQFQTSETAGAVVNGSCTNDAGLTTDAAPLTVKLDKTGPSASLAVTAGTLGSNGWYTSDVTVGTSGTDLISGPPTCTADQFQTTETTGAVVNGSCTNDAGLTTDAAPLTVKLDKTGPSASLAVTAGTLGSNGWYTSDVTVGTSGTDLISGPPTCTADQFQTTETTGAVVNGSCTNDAGLTTDAAPLTVKLDKTGPSASLAVTAGTLGSNGWYTSDVTVGTSGTDLISGPPTCTADQFQTTETTGAVFNGSCTNDAGLTTNAAPLTVKLDKTGPSASLAVTAGTLGSNGWYTSDVTVGTSGTDTISGPPTCTADQFQTSETTGAVFTGSCTNDAGLTTNAAPLTVKLDKTAPVISDDGPTPSTPNGLHGWYVSAVSNAFSASDGMSGLDACPFPKSVSTGASEGAAVTVPSGSCSDLAGNTNAGMDSALFMIDLTNPSVTCATPPHFLLNQAGALVSANVSDTQSGYAVSPVTALADTSTIGGHSANVTGYDNAGRSTTMVCGYFVGYVITAFSAPIDNPSVVNAAKAGQAIPVKWRLTDANGVGVSDPASFVSVTSSPSGTCGGTLADVIETYSGSSGLQYLGDGYWQFNWKTPKTYVGQCRTMFLNLADQVPPGPSTRYALFTFK